MTAAAGAGTGEVPATLRGAVYAGRGEVVVERPAPGCDECEACRRGRPSVRRRATNRRG